MLSETTAATLAALPGWAQVTMAILLVVAGLFALVGSYGLIRLPDPMTRLHAPTKATTVGVGGVLIGSMVGVFAREGRLSGHELLITLCLFLTAPVTALFIAKVHVHLREKRQTLPKPVSGPGWATHEAEGPARGVSEAHAGSDRGA